MRASSVLVFHQQFALGSDDLVGRNEVAVPRRVAVP